MDKPLIFVEGIADQKFIKDLIEEWYGVSLKVSNVDKPGSEILALGGVDAFDSPEKMKKVAPIIETQQIKEIPIIAILDADVFVENDALISSHSSKFGFTYFLLPNHNSDGELETLLQSIINKQNQVIFNCWNEFENCLVGHEALNTLSGKFTLPANKTKIYAYLETLLGETSTEKEKIKERNRDYRNKKHWNLDPTQPELKALKAFLDPFFT